VLPCNIVAIYDSFMWVKFSCFITLGNLLGLFLEFENAWVTGICVILVAALIMFLWVYDHSVTEVRFGTWVIGICVGWETLTGHTLVFFANGLRKSLLKWALDKLVRTSVSFVVVVHLEYHFHHHHEYRGCSHQLMKGLFGVMIFLYHLQGIPMCVQLKFINRHIFQLLMFQIQYLLPQKSGHRNIIKVATKITHIPVTQAFSNSGKRPNKFPTVIKQENLTHMNESAIATNLQGNTREVELGTFVGARKSNYTYHNEAQNLNPRSKLEVEFDTSTCIWTKIIM